MHDKQDDEFKLQLIEEYRELVASQDIDWPSLDYRVTRMKQIDRVLESLARAEQIETEYVVDRIIRKIDKNIVRC